MKKVLKKIAIIYFINIFLLTFIFDRIIISNAEDDEIAKAKKQIVNYAIAFANSPEAAKCQYFMTPGSGPDDPGNKARAETYKASDPQDKYVFDCVGFVSYMINRAIGITCPQAENGTGGFVTPNGVSDVAHFVLSDTISNVEPGDILMAPDAPHVGIYLGDYKMIDCRSAGVKITELDSNFTMKEYRGCTFTKCAKLISMDGGGYDPIQGGKLPEGGTSAVKDEINLDEISKDFELSGMPTDMEYVESKSIFKWFFESITGFMDFLAGLLISIIKSAIVGYISLFENAVNGLLHSVNG